MNHSFSIGSHGMDSLKLKLEEKASGIEGEKEDIESELMKLKAMESLIMKILALVS